MALFDLGPKESRKGLFGRDRELAELVRLVNAGRWAVVLGPRMVGKTSLVKAAADSVDRPSIYVNLWGARGTLGFVNAFVHGLNASRPVLARVREALRRVEGVSIGPGGLSVAAPHRPLRTVWDLLDLIGSQAETSLIVFDEIQEVAAASGTLLRLLGNVFNSHPKVVFLFTGSRFGLVRTLLDPTENSPLFGRPPASLQLHPFASPTSVEFLERGLREFRLRLPRAALEQVVERSLDGLPGWLTLFGNQVAVQRLEVAAAERSTVAEGKKVVRGELVHFFEGRDRRMYWDALRTMALGASWSEVRHSLSQRRGAPVNDNTVRNVLRTLLDAGLATQRDERYVLPDPMVRAFVLGAARPP